MQSSARPSCRSSDSAAVSSSLLKRSASTPLLSPSLTTLQRILHWSWPKMVSRSNSGITPSNYQSRTPPTHCSVASADSPFSGTHTGFMFPNFRAEFVNLASTPATPIQMAVHNERPMAGAQFHPEYRTEEHSDGRTVIANFLAWSMGLEPQPASAGLISTHTSRRNGVVGGG